MKRVLAIWLPNWPIQRLTSKRPELRGRPIILHSASRGSQSVVACSTVAQKLGAAVGMPLAEALALVNSELHREAHDPSADRQALEKLAQWCHRFSPTVGFEAGELPETLLLDATSLGSLFGGEQVLVDQIACGFARIHLQAHIALSDTIGAAWALAHFGAEPDKPPIVPTGEDRAALEPLPMAALRLPDALLETLGQLGLERAGDLFALPRDQLQSRFGPLLLERIDQALGRRAEVIRACTSPTELTAEWLLEYPVTDRRLVRHIVQQLVERVVWQLTARGEGALSLVCQLTCPEWHDSPSREFIPKRHDSESRATLSRQSLIFEVGLFRPSDRASHLLELIDMHLERLLLPSPVTQVELRVARRAPLARRQRELFTSERSLDDSSQLAALVDRLAGRLGPRAVVRCHLKNDAQPELAYRTEPLVDRNVPKGRTPGSKTRAKPTSLAPLDRPLALLPRPTRLEVLAVAPDGPPIRFAIRGRQHDVARHWGPERIETGWWRRRGMRRDYYRVETAEGRRFWLFRRRSDRRWFLHGVFE